MNPGTLRLGRERIVGDLVIDDFFWIAGTANRAYNFHPEIRRQVDKTCGSAPEPNCMSYRGGQGKPLGDCSLDALDLIRAEATLRLAIVQSATKCLQALRSIQVHARSNLLRFLIAGHRKIRFSLEPDLGRVSKPLKR